MTVFDYDLDRSTDFSGTTAASPEWQDQIIYFVVTDRFYNGNTSNDRDTTELPTYDERVPIAGQPDSGYNGGDFAGIQQKLDYIQGIGATTVWLTPPVKNQVHEGWYHGYHGYWASDFTQTDFHFGTLAEYQSLVSAAHNKGMYVVQDIVVNHTGDYMKIGQTVTSDMLKNKPLSESIFKLNAASLPTNKPVQLPWSMNDPNDYTPDELKYSSFYNWNPNVTDYNNASQLLTYQMSDLDDMKTANPVVQNLLRGYFRYWIDKANIDGYRIDTAVYVEETFFEGFINSNETGNQGVRTYAQTVGKDDFISFGETWNTDDTKIARYTVNPSTGAKRMDSLIYFPLTFAIRDTFSTGGATNNISTILNRRYTVGYDNPDRLVTFIDNHDMDRLLRTTDPELVKAAYALIMTIPGIPQIYYGSEQGFDEEGARRAMFAGGYAGEAGMTNAADLFDTSNTWYTFFQDIISLRKNNRIFRYNALEVVKDTSFSSGIFSYRLTEKDAGGSLMSGINHEALVIMNTSETSQVFDVTSSFTAGDKLELLSPSTTGFPADIIVQTGGTVKAIVPAKGYGIFLLTDVGQPVDDGTNTIEITSTYPTAISTNEITLEGTLSHAADIKIVFNDNFTNVQNETVTGTAFSIPCDISTLSNGENTVKALLVINEGSNSYAYSNSVTFTIERPYELVVTDPAVITDPEGDDNGPPGKTYGLPTNTTFSGHQMDITGVEVRASGSDLEITITTPSMSKGWNPTKNMYDHVLFNIFLAKPGSTEGCTVQPNHNYTLPDNFAWDYMMKAEGWSTAFYSSEGADATNNGTSVTPAPTSIVEWEGANTTQSPGIIKFRIKAESIGRPASLAGWKIYINTYDMDTGKLRGMVQAPDEWKFSGGNMDTDPLVIDETAIITIVSTN
ncbi:hypothetical protein K7I13_06305 [Brucepastera parasyntrophica]|uniref:alpha-amylase family glycosyl hydrolase n=1 Tax=Brucepastera parasyntrophica TaxID=2880008 RepID=UPI00210CE01D|nr:alpha-amylase family glycosyl hydrolase [Brucepastera parasyntrophica]ULQ60873.1 hypothetical protein K7I13_06305 [Brucepastera parasyntrophica]